MATGPVKHTSPGLNVVYTVTYTELEYKGFGRRSLIYLLYGLLFLGVLIWMWTTGQELVFFSQAVILSTGCLGFLSLAANNYTRTL